MQAWEGDTNCLNCAIRSTALFSGLTAQDFEKIHNPVEQVTLKPGELLYKVGDTGHHLFTVRSGLVKLVQYLPDGTQRIVRLVKSTGVLGLEVLVNSQYEHEAVVLHTTKLCRYSKEAVLQLSQTSPILHKNLMEQWQRALTGADAWLTKFSTGAAKKRMANLLMRLREEETDECYLFSREDMGSILSVTIETASRMISEFKRLNLMREIRPNHFSLDIEGLEKIIAS